MLKFNLLLLLGLVVGCASFTREKLKPEEQAYLSRVAGSAPVFDISNAKAEEAWSRGLEFMKKYSSSSLDLADGHASTLGKPVRKAAYDIFREPNGERVKFTIRCEARTRNKAASHVCDNNEKLLAHYMKTGELNPKFVNAQITNGETQLATPGDDESFL